MDIRAILMGLAFAFMWSSAFTSARIIVAEAPPMTTLAIRFVISGGLAIGLALALGQSWRLTRAQAWATILFGICQNTLYLGLNFVAMQTVQASLASIIASTLPLLVAFFTYLGGTDRPQLLGLVGLAGGMVGVLLVMGGRLQAGGVDMFGVWLCVGGVLALTLATLSLRTASSGGNLLMVVGLQMVVGAVPLAALGLATEQLEATGSWRLIAAFTYTTLVPGLLATLVWFWLVERIGAIKAATFHFLNPFFGVAVAAAILGEQLGALDIAGVLVIAASILAVQLSRTRTSK